MKKDVAGKRLGEFELKCELGRGGMGVVYEARQTSLNRRVALKVLPANLFTSSRMVQRFQREAEAAADLCHPNIVPIYTTGQTGDLHYYAMELVEGPTLSDVLRRLRQERADDSSITTKDDPATLNLLRGGPFEVTDPTRPPPLPWSPGRGSYFVQAARMMAEVADALDHAHRNGVIHRDVKPANLLLSPQGRLKVTDFGVAKLLEQAGMTVTGEVLGTPAYMSPEQVMAGETPIDHRADVYSLGATLFELLTLQVPFSGQRRELIFVNIVQTKPIAPRKLNPAVPRELEAICLKCLEKSPDRRYASSAEVAEELRCYVNHRPVRALRPRPLERLLMWGRQHSGLASLAMIALVVALAACIAVAFRARQDNGSKTSSRTQVAVEEQAGGKKADQLQVEPARGNKPEVAAKEKQAPPVAPPDRPDEVDDQKPQPSQVRFPEPDQNRIGVADYLGGASGVPTVLVSRQEGGDKWQPFKAGDTVYSSDAVLALPGFAGVVRTRSRVDVTLRGLVREFSIAEVMNFMMDSAVVFHASNNFDLDLTLLRGRVYLTNRKDKGSAKIRLRFEKEVWDLTLAGKGDEAVVDLARSYDPVINQRAGDEPRVNCFLALLSGQAELKIDAYQMHTLEAEPPAWVRMEWDSFTRVKGPIKVAQATPALSKQSPPPELLHESRRESARRMETALKSMEAQLGTSKLTVEVALQEALQKREPATRVLAVYCLTAIGSVGPVIDVLGDEDRDHYLDREAAFLALQQWVWRSAKQTKILYDEKSKTGLLTDKKYKQREAETFVHLLHPLLAGQLTKAETYETLARCLSHRRVAIAEMGFWHLNWLSGGAKLPPGWNAALPLEDRERYSAQVQKMIDDKKLPPAGPSMEKGPPVKK